MSDAARRDKSAADPLDASLGEKLWDGLRALPVPPVSPEFDERVLRALEVPAVPWWRAGWLAARPVLAAGACALVAGLVLLRFAGSLPTDEAATGPLATRAASFGGNGVDADALIELAARRRAALRAVLSAPPAPTTPTGSPATPDRRSEARIAPLA